MTGPSRLLRRCALQPIREGLAELGDLRRYDGLAIAGPRIAREVVVMLGLGGVEYLQRLDLCHDRRGPDFGVGDLLDDRLRRGALRVGVREDDRAVLRPDVVALA